MEDNSSYKAKPPESAEPTLRKVSKSYWQRMSVRNQAAIRSCLSPLADDDMTVESAEILCDKQTDKEKKLRAVLIAPDGRRFRFTRTMGRSVSLKRERLS